VVVVQRALAMAYVFDSLGYAKRLRDGGVPQEQAEVHAEAARDFIMAELASRSDLLAMKQELQSEFRSSTSELRSKIIELRCALETQGLRLTVRLAAMMVIMIGALATILKLT
jgi:hypothetical protein